MMVELSELIEKIPEKDIINFQPRLSGQCYAKNKKRLAKISIAFPEEIVGESLSDLDKWKLIVIAMKKESYEKVYLELSKEEKRRDE